MTPLGSLSRSLALICLSLLLSCESSTDLGKKVVLKVNNHELSGKEFADQLALRLRGQAAISANDPRTISRAKQDIIARFVMESLVRDAAAEQGIQISDEMIRKEMDSMRSGFPDDLSFRKALAEEDISIQVLKNRISSILVNRLFFEKLRASWTTPSEAEIKSFYETNRSKYLRKERIYLRQIVVDELVKAEELRKALGQKDFGSLASKFSISPEAKQGGVIGWVERDSLDVFDKAFALPAGAISQPLESPYGVHIFKVEKKRPAGTASLDEVRLQIQNEIEAQREQAAFLSWLDKSLRKSSVFKNAEYIDRMLVETRSTL